MARSSGFLRLALLAAAFFAFAPQLCFVASPAGKAPRRLVARRVRGGEDEAYPHLIRVEDLIYESCLVKEGQQEIECLRSWDKLRKFHENSAMECSVDDIQCVVLDVLDRLCRGIEGRDGIALLNKVSSAALAFREKFQEDWNTAFDAVDTHNSGYVDFEELVAAMDSIGAKMSKAEVRIIFDAADARGDGKLWRDEFSDFLTAAIFAEEPLSKLAVDSMPKKQTDFNDYLRWSTAGRGGSWSGMAGLSRARL